MAVILQAGLIIFIILAVGISLKPPYRVKNKKDLGIPFASPIYADEKGVKLLTAPELGLKGKPDYIFKTWIFKRYIPLEMKSGILKEEVPHLGDVYQLATYFLIIEEVYGKRPPYGKLVYANKTFIIRNTRKIRKQLQKTIYEMRGMLAGKRTPSPETSFIKCRHCICQQTVCEFYKGDN